MDEILRERVAACNLNALVTFPPLFIYSRCKDLLFPPQHVKKSIKQTNKGMKLWEMNLHSSLISPLKVLNFTLDVRQVENLTGAITAHQHDWCHSS